MKKGGKQYYFTEEDFNKFQSDIQKWKESKQIILPPEEYAEVMSEFNTHMSDADKEHYIVTKPIGNFYYTLINRGFDDYIVIGKHPIVTDVEALWEEET